MASNRVAITRHASVSSRPVRANRKGLGSAWVSSLQAAMLEWKLLSGITGGSLWKGVAVAFIVHASRGEDATTTYRLSVAGAVAKGCALVEKGWEVFITDPDGDRFYPAEFHILLSSRRGVHWRP
jgi:hypothetical protein